MLHFLLRRTCLGRNIVKLKPQPELMISRFICLLNHKNVNLQKTHCTFKFEMVIGILLLYCVINCFFKYKQFKFITGWRYNNGFKFNALFKYLISSKKIFIFLKAIKNNLSCTKPILDGQINWSLEIPPKRVSLIGSNFCLLK